MERKRPERIEGYVHPENTVYDNSRLYKTFDENNKKATYESNFHDTYLSGYDDTFSGCPECEKQPVTTCNCIYTDKRCENNHIWYTNRDGDVVLGNPHTK